MPTHKVNQQNSDSKYIDHLLETIVQTPTKEKGFKVAFASAIWLTLGAIWLPGFGSFGNVIDLPEPKIEERPQHTILRVDPKKIEVSQPIRQRTQKAPMPEHLIEDPQPEMELEEIEAPSLLEDTFTLAEPDLPTAPPELADTIYGRNSVGLEMPVFLKKVSPTYPRRAISLKLQGYVLVEAILGKNGEIRDIKIVRGLGKSRFGFEESAIKALKQWEFQPGKLHEKPVDVRMTLQLRFSLR